MLSLESLNRGDSNEYTQYSIFSIEKKITQNNPKSSAMGFFQGTENKFETAVTVKKRKIYGRITGNQLPVPVPLFLRELVQISYMVEQDRAT